MTKKEIIIETNKKSVKLSSDDILYITTNKEKDHMLSFITEQSTFHCRGVLDDFEYRMRPIFFRSHRSILVNLTKIREINRATKKIYFTNHITCSFSRRNLSPLLQAWKDA